MPIHFWLLLQCVTDLRVCVYIAADLQSKVFLFQISMKVVSRTCGGTPSRSYGTIQISSMTAAKLCIVRHWLIRSRGQTVAANVTGSDHFFPFFFFFLLAFVLVAFFVSIGTVPVDTPFSSDSLTVVAVSSLVLVTPSIGASSVDFLYCSISLSQNFDVSLVEPTNNLPRSTVLSVRNLTIAPVSGS